MKDIYFNIALYRKQHPASTITFADKMYRDVNIILAGTSIYSMPVTDKNEQYDFMANTYDIHFIFDDNIPDISFFTVPHVEIVATDGEGGFFGTIGEWTDLTNKAPFCYIDKTHNCYIAANTFKEFVEHADEWRLRLRKTSGLKIYENYEQAKNELEFVIYKELSASN